jgi:hypothetical protein
MTGAVLIARFILNKMQFLPSLAFRGRPLAHKVEFSIMGSMPWSTHQPKVLFSGVIRRPAVQ